jgi:hypothetical protein
MVQEGRARVRGAVQQHHPEAEDPSVADMDLHEEAAEQVQHHREDAEHLPKNKKIRIAALPDPLAKLLACAKAQQEVYLRRKVKDSDYVYMTKVNLVNEYLPNSRKLDNRFMEFQKRVDRVRKYARLEPIPTIRLHDLRHTFISLCLNSGKVNPLQVAANVGHSMKGMTTFTTYWHDQGDRKEILDFIDGIITFPIEPLDMEQNLNPPTNTTTNRRNLRNDEITFNRICCFPKNIVLMEDIIQSLLSYFP